MFPLFQGGIGGIEIVAVQPTDLIYFYFHHNETTLLPDLGEGGWG